MKGDGGNSGPCAAMRQGGRRAGIEEETGRKIREGEDERDSVG